MSNVNDSNINPKLVNIPSGFSNFPQPGKLQQLYDVNHDNLYSKISPFTENSGLLSFGPKQPFVYINPDKGRSGINGLKRFENRSFPIGSGTQDVERIGKFMVTGNGIMFLTKQFLLQRSNSFNETRIYNPLSPIAASVRAAGLFSTDYPTRHVEGGLLGALAGLVGLSITKPSRVSGTIGTLPTEGSNNYKGLIRAETANNALNRFKSLHGGGSGPGGLLDKVMSKVGGPIGTAYGLFNSFKSNQQDGSEKSDEVGYDIMLNSPKLAGNKINNPTKSAGLTGLFDSIFPSPTTFDSTLSIRQRWFNDKNTDGEPNIERRLRLNGGTFIENENVTLSTFNIGYELSSENGSYSNSINSKRGTIYENSDIILIYNKLYSGKIPGIPGDRDRSTSPIETYGTYSNDHKEFSGITNKQTDKYNDSISSSVGLESLHKVKNEEPIYSDIPHGESLKTGSSAQYRDGTYSNKHPDDDKLKTKTNLDDRYKEKSDALTAFGNNTPENNGYSQPHNVVGTYSQKTLEDGNVLIKYNKDVVGLNRPIINTEEFGDDKQSQSTSWYLSSSNRTFKGENISVLSEKKQDEISLKLNSLLVKLDFRQYNNNFKSEVDLDYTSLSSHIEPLLKPNGYEKRVIRGSKLDDNGSEGGKGFSGVGRPDYVNKLEVLDSIGAYSPPDHFGERTNGKSGIVTYEPYKQDQIAFYFHDLVNDKYIPFRSTVKGINEQLTANWSEINYIGRSDKLYNYTGFARTLNFSFAVVAMSVEELLPMWKRINYLASLVKPSKYTKSEMSHSEEGSTSIISTSNFIIPPLVAITIGDLYKEQPLIIQNITITVPDDASWETLSEQENTNWNYLNGKIEWRDSIGKYAQFPRECEISIGGPLLEQERPQVGKNNFGGVGIHGRKFSTSLIVGEKIESNSPKFGGVGR